jgi:hypothetical protein
METVMTEIFFPDKPMEYFSVSKETKYTMENVLLINLILTKLLNYETQNYSYLI